MMSARLEKYKDFKKTAFCTDTLQRLNIAEISPMRADSKRNSNTQMCAADLNRKSDILTMSAALSCQCDGPACSKLYAKTPCVESLSALNVKIKICDMKS